MSLSSSFLSRSRRLPFVLALVVILAFAAWFRWYPGSEIHFTHPDEPIVVFVVDHMRTSGTWDTNWKSADLPADFKYPQYNFSGYHVVASLWAGLVQKALGNEVWISYLTVQWYRWLSAILGVVSVALAGFVAFRIRGIHAGLLAAALTAFHVQLLQDGHYGRAETLLTVLTLTSACLAVHPKNASGFSLAITAILAGFAFSIKVTALALLVFPVALALNLVIKTPRARIPIFIATLLFFLAGAYLGMPGAFSHPGDYLYGLSRLHQQYTHETTPQSFFRGGAVWLLLVRYYLETLWPLSSIFILIGTLITFQKKNWKLALTLSLPFWSTVFYFAHTQVFFERNLSHVLPLGFILAGMAFSTLMEKLPPKRVLRLPVAVLVLAICIYPSLLIDTRFVSQDLTGEFVHREKSMRVAVHSQRPTAKGVKTTLTRVSPDWWKFVDETVSKQPLLLEVTDFNDPGTVHGIAELRRRYTTREAAVLPTLYPTLPVCTLLVYHSPTMRFFWVLCKK